MEPKTLTRIASNPKIFGGTPAVAGTRVPADTVLAEIRDKKAMCDIFTSYPSLPPNGVEACLEWERSGRPL